MTVGEHGRARVSEGEPAHLALVSAHPARASQRVRAARGFISPKQAGPPIYSYLWGDSLTIYSASTLAATGGLSAPGAT